MSVSGIPYPASSRSPESVEGTTVPDTRWGVTIPLSGVHLRDHRVWLEEIEALGYTDAWVPEGGGFDAITTVALAMAWTSSLRVGAGVISSFTRGPALIANTAAAMAD